MADQPARPQSDKPNRTGVDPDPTKVGYKMPPKHGQIKKGEVRNKWGPKGKPKPEPIDAFEFAASQPTMVTVNGKKIEVAAEVASQLVNMQAAIAGDRRAHKNVQDERRSRRRRGEHAPTAEQLLQQQKEAEESRVLSEKIAKALNFYVVLKKSRLVSFCDGEFYFSPWLEQAIIDYRIKHGASPLPSPHGEWSPHPEIAPGPDDKEDKD